MNLQLTELGGERTDEDGCRRYRPIALTFDSRNAMLDQQIGDDWEPTVQEQWRTNQSSVRMELLAELGTVDGEAKIDNYRLLGPAPWSIIYEHNELLKQIRTAFAHGDFYPALVGACALGERVFNLLLIELRDDYQNHPSTTKQVRLKQSFDNWRAATDVLHGWGVLDDDTRTKYRQLAKRRHASVHYDPQATADMRTAALQAIVLVQDIVSYLFAALGGPPKFIVGVPGASYFTQEAEQLPLVKRVLLPRCALLSPTSRIEPRLLPNGPNGNHEWLIFDDVDYDSRPLTDREFAAAIRPA